jgi:hypothetical protein
MNFLLAITTPCQAGAQSPFGMTRTRAVSETLHQEKQQKAVPLGDGLLFFLFGSEL